MSTHYSNNKFKHIELNTCQSNVKKEDTIKWQNLQIIYIPPPDVSLYFEFPQVVVCKASTCVLIKGNDDKKKKR